jgi:hypothetical protein
MDMRVLTFRLPPFVRWLLSRRINVLALNRPVGAPLSLAALICAIVFGTLIKQEVKISKIGRAAALREADIFLTEFSGVRIVENVAISDPSPYEQTSLKLHDRVNLVGVERVHSINGRMRSDQIEPVSIVAEIPIVKAIVNVTSLLHTDVRCCHYFASWRLSRILKVENQASNWDAWIYAGGAIACLERKTGIVDKSALYSDEAIAGYFVGRFHRVPLTPSEIRIDGGYASDNTGDDKHSVLVRFHVGGRLLGIALALVGMLLIYRGLLGRSKSDCLRLSVQYRLADGVLCYRPVGRNLGLSTTRANHFAFCRLRFFIAA